MRNGQWTGSEVRFTGSFKEDESWLTPAVSSTDGPLRGCGCGNQRLRLSFHARKRTLQVSSGPLRSRWTLNCYLFHYNGLALRIVRGLNGFLYLRQMEPISFIADFDHHYTNIGVFAYSVFAQYSQKLRRFLLFYI